VLDIAVAEARLHYCQAHAVWLMAVAIAGAIYFFPIARLVDSLGD